MAQGALLSQNVKDFVQKRDRKVEESGAGGASANAGAFVLKESIKSNKEQMENREKKSDEKDWMPIPRGFFEFINT